MRGAAVGVASAVLLATSLAAVANRSGGSPPDVVVASTTTTQATALPGPSVLAAPPQSAAAAPAAPAVRHAGEASPLKVSDGRAYGAAIPFVSSIPVPSELTFVLVVGSDARRGEDVRRANADSVHVLAVNPGTREGTVVGIPRDSYVDIPGRGRDKINSAMQKGGPGLLVDTVRRLTGLPIQFYVVTGFEGLTSMVDALGGVDVLVGRRMDDRLSGARFERGWHHFNGAQALAFTRNRHDTDNGDFGRSENHGVLILAALGKMRAEVADDDGIRHWAGALMRHVSFDVAGAQIPRLAALGRNIDPARVRNVVVPGRIGFAGRQSVVHLDGSAAQLFEDLRADAVIGGAAAPPATAPPPTAAPERATPPSSEAPPSTEPATTTTSAVVDLLPGP